MMPEGMGLAYLVALIVFIIASIILIFILKFIHKRIKFKRIFLLLVSLILFLIFGVTTRHISLTSSHIIDNNPLENPIKISIQKDSFYFELEDGRSFEFIDKYQKGSFNKDYIQVGHSLDLDKTDKKGEIKLYGIGITPSYYHHEMFAKDIWFTIPIFHNEIVKNERRYLGKIHQLQ